MIAHGSAHHLDPINGECGLNRRPQFHAVHAADTGGKKIPEAITDEGWRYILASCEIGGVRLGSTSGADNTGAGSELPTEQDVVEPSEALGPSRRHATKHLLVVLGADASEVVRAAGGLIYDWSVGGWDIVVHLSTSRDDRPLRILGAKAEPLTSLGGPRSDSPWPDAIIASSLLYHQDRPVRDYFNEASMRNYAATAMLGDDWPAGLGQGIGQVRHQLSPAARAFKLQAMLAAELAPVASDSMEVFRGFADRLASTRLVSVAPHNLAETPSAGGNELLTKD